MRYNKLKNFLFGKKELIIISDNKIITKRYTGLTKVVSFCFATWSIYLGFLHVQDQQTIKDKNKYIEELVSVNEELNTNINKFAGLFSNVKSHIYSLNLYDRFAKIESNDLEKNISVVNDDFLDNKTYNNILPILAKIENETNEINSLINSRISNIEDLIVSTGIDKNELRDVHLVNYQDENKYNSEEYLISKVSPVKKTDFDNINKKVDYLNHLESFINSMPITNPMRNYRITSNFGDRPDPFEKNSRFHRGVDLAGPINTNVVATADGEVISATKKGGYGNYVKLRHKNSITTEYAHLKNIKVKVGDFVKRGDTLGLQGNTGRSTGEHLHYEIKIDNKVQNPKNFINVGNEIF